MLLNLSFLVCDGDIFGEGERVEECKNRPLPESSACADASASPASVMSLPPASLPSFNLGYLAALASLEVLQSWTALSFSF